MKRRTVGGALVVLLAVVSGSIATVASASSATPATGTPPTGTITEHGWSLVPKDATGLDTAASFDSLVSNGDAFLLAAGRGPTTGRGRRSGGRARLAVDRDRAPNDGLAGDRGRGRRRHRARDRQHERERRVGLCLAFGRRRGELDRGGRWKRCARHSRARDGPAQVSGLLRHDGWWVASGGRSDGYAAIWISRGGARWRQVLGPNVAGSASAVQGRAGWCSRRGARSRGSPAMWRNGACRALGSRPF